MTPLKKCAHPACTCMTTEKYCSPYCRDKAASVEISCGCKHDQCTGRL